MILNASKRTLLRASRVARRLGRPCNMQELQRLAYLTIARDPLYGRAMWRSQGLPLKRKASVVGGVKRWFLAP